MKRLISLILVMLLFTSAVFASSDSSEDIMKTQDIIVSNFVYTASAYLPMGNENRQLSFVSTTGKGDSQITVYLLQRGDNPAMNITITGTNKFEIEFVDDSEELELDFTRALVFSKYKMFDYLEMVNALPQNMLLMSKHTKVYAVIISSMATLQYFVTRTGFSDYSHHIVLMYEKGLYGF